MTRDAQTPVPRRATLGEADARRLALLHALETATPAEQALWSAADRDAASRAARETTPAGAGPEVYLAERARHAAHRLQQRRPEVAKLLRETRPLSGPLGLVAAAALVIGLLLETLGPQQRINLLAPPLWGVLAWNLIVMAALALRLFGASGVPGPLRRALLAWREGPAADATGGALARFAAQWARASAPLHAQRLAIALHVGAACIAIGLVLGLYLRGVAWDYRAGWESTWLDAATVQRLLGLALAPAGTLTGIALPDAAGMAALRLAPGAPAAASAAPWLHLLAGTLALFVIAPRLLLAAAATLRLAWRRGHWPLDLADPHWARLLRQWQRRDESIAVLPHGEPPGAAAALGLREVFAAAYGDKVQVQVAAATPYGAEEQAATLALPPGATVLAMWADLAATPEAEAQGRFLAALQARAKAAGQSTLLLLDETAWQRRFAGLPQRLAERRAAWRALAEAQGVPMLAAAFESPAAAEVAAELDRVLAAGAGA